MRGWVASRVRAAMAGAASLTGKRFGLLVASSLVATAAIVAAGMTSGGRDLGPLAALVGRSLAAQRVAAAPEAAPAPEPEPAPAVEPEPEPAPAAVASEPEPAPVVAAAPAVSSEEAAPKPQPEPEEAPPPEEQKPEAGPVKHVFVIALASPGYEATFGPVNAQMPYLSGTLRPQGDLLSGYTLLSESWLANSFAAIAGQKPSADSERDCPEYEACLFPVETLSFADQLASAQLSWRGYFEGMADAEGKPASCVHPEPGAAEAPVPGGYSPVINPFAYFHTLLDLGECAADDVPLTELKRDLRKTEKTPNFTYISPDLCNAGVAPGECVAGAPEGAATADAWLATWVPKILASPAYEKDGLLIVTFGAVNPVPNPDPTQPPTQPTSLKTGTLLVSKLLTPGSTDATRYDPYTLLATYEDLFGLDRLGEAGARRVKSLAPQFLAR